MGTSEDRKTSSAPPWAKKRQNVEDRAALYDKWRDLLHDVEGEEEAAELTPTDSAVPPPIPTDDPAGLTVVEGGQGENEGLWWERPAEGAEDADEEADADAAAESALEAEVAAFDSAPVPPVVQGPPMVEEPSPIIEDEAPARPAWTDDEFDSVTPPPIPDVSVEPVAEEADADHSVETVSDVEAVMPPPIPVIEDEAAPEEEAEPEAEVEEEVEAVTPPPIPEIEDEAAPEEEEQPEAEVEEEVEAVTPPPIPEIEDEATPEEEAEPEAEVEEEVEAVTPPPIPEIEDEAALEEQEEVEPETAEDESDEPEFALVPPTAEVEPVAEEEEEPAVEAEADPDAAPQIPELTDEAIEAAELAAEEEQEEVKAEDESEPEEAVAPAIPEVFQNAITEEPEPEDEPEALVEVPEEEATAEQEEEEPAAEVTPPPVQAEEPAEEEAEEPGMDLDEMLALAGVNEEEEAQDEPKAEALAEVPEIELHDAGTTLDEEADAAIAQIMDAGTDEDEEELEPEPEEAKAEEPAVDYVVKESDLNLDEIKSADGSFRWRRLGDLLVDNGLLSDSQVTEALREQATANMPLGETMVSLGLLEPKALLRILAAQMDVQSWHPDDCEPEVDALRLMVADYCRENTVLPIRVREGRLHLAMSDPLNIQVIDEVKSQVGMSVEPMLAHEQELEEQIGNSYNRDSRSHQARVNALVSQAMEGVEDTARPATADMSLSDIDKETKPVVGIVNKIILDGVKMRASDVHIEPTDEGMQVRYRIDGRLMIASTIPAELIPMVTARIKIMAEIDPVEWRIPQDGRIYVEAEGRQIDLRLSVLPTHFGGRIVMRILDRTLGLMKMDDLGFSEANLTLFRRLIRRPYGLFLVTGPTGSGKTTTLYSALNDVKNEETNIITCEDPIEYNLEGISQSQVNTKIGLTFASQLRSILRQDPDTVLVGEIRDQETAETAIRAAMTGHMVFSTLHSNTAPGSIPRLLDMGVDPFLLSTSLIGVMGQRLLRRACSECIKPVKPNKEELELLELSFGRTDVKELFKGEGCQHCGGTGYRGRMAVHEILPVSDEVGALITQGADTADITEQGRRFGYRTMQQDAMDRVLNGTTTLEEARRLLAFNDIPEVDPETGELLEEAA